jgi:hypothetical protein
LLDRIPQDEKLKKAENATTKTPGMKEMSEMTKED